MSNKYPGGFVSLGGQTPSYSVVFDGSGDYLSVADNTALDMEASDFTMECWFQPNTSASVAGQTIFGKRANAGTIGGVLLGFWGTDLKPAMYATVNGSTWGVSNVTSSVALLVGVWSHLAFTRSGSTWTIWVNGFATATATLAGTVPNNSSAFTIGATSADGSDTICASNISNVRIVKGTALYTTNFVPPTGPLKNITNTSLLTCQSSTLIDNSSNVFTVTASGNAAVSTVQPNFQAYNPNNLDPALGAATPGVWTLSQALAAEVTRSWPMYDPYYKNVVLNLHGNTSGTVDSSGTPVYQNNTFLDSSGNNFTITRNGNTTQGSFSPYGSNWSNYFGGSNSGLSIPSSTAFDFSGDFTIEGWVFITSKSNATLISRTTGAGVHEFWIGWDSTTLSIFYNGSNVAYPTDSFSTNQWQHYALVRSGSSVVFYINGVNSGSFTNSSSWSSSSAVTVGYAGALSGYGMIGYQSNVRIVKGTAVYTSNFTPSTTPLTAISGTSLLTCQANRFLDAGTANSGSPFTVTPVSTATVQRFQPFLFNTSYTPSVIGGSGYFDGTGDYLTIPNNAVFKFGTGDYTIEFWMYYNAYGSFATAVRTDLGTPQWVCQSASGVMTYYINGSTVLTDSSAPGLSTWVHYAIVRSGSGSNNTKMYRNGVQVAQATNTTDMQPTSQVVVGSGGDSSITNYALNGYLSDVRITKGGALYTTAFTPPTAPLTTTVSSGTVSLLTNMTNGAIYDNAAMNDFETVGNAQISTSVKKYGTASMYFDGTGDYLTSQAALPRLGTSDFTIEWWEYRTSTGNDKPVMQGSGAYANYDPIFGYSGSTNNLMYLSSNNSSWNMFSAFNMGSIDLNTWNHFAITRSGSTFRSFKNGVLTNTGTSSSSIYQSANGWSIGVAQLTSQVFQGYLDDVRVTIGYARYVANFTPPTSQLQDQ